MIKWDRRIIAGIGGVALMATLALVACGGNAPTSAVATQEMAPATKAAPVGTTAPGATARKLTLKAAEGQVQVSVGGAAATAATVGQELTQGDTITVGADGFALLEIEDGTQASLSANTEVALKTLEGTAELPVTRLALITGDIHVFHEGALPAGAAFEIESEKGIATFQHSKLSVAYDKETGKTRVTCLEGPCTLSKDGQSVTLQDRQALVVSGPTFDQSFVREMTQEELQGWIDNASKCGCLNNLEIEALETEQASAPTEEDTPEATETATSEATEAATSEPTEDATDEATSEPTETSTEKPEQPDKPEATEAATSSP